MPPLSRCLASSYLPVVDVSNGTGVVLSSKCCLCCCCRCCRATKCWNRLFAAALCSSMCAICIISGDLSPLSIRERVSHLQITFFRMRGYMTIICNSCHSITDLQRKNRPENATLNDIQCDLCLCFQAQISANTEQRRAAVHVQVSVD